MIKALESPSLGEETTSTPIDAPHQDRLGVLDALRGFAILGIFLINLPIMGPTNGPSMAKAVHLSTIDRIAQTFADLFFEGTQRGLLQMLFGSGMILLTTKAMSPSGPVSIADTYLRRNMWLILFGLMHIFVVRWGYDILHVYGLAALFLLTFRKLPAPAALALGLSFAVLSYFVPINSGIHGASELASRGNIDAPVLSAVDMWYDSVKGLNLWSTVAEAFCTMLIGVALFKWSIIQGLRSTRFYLLFTVFGYALGLALRLPTTESFLTPAKGPNSAEFGRLIMTLGHVGLINLLWRGGRIGEWLLSPLLAAGRTAFSLYVMQSVIGIWVLWASWGPLTVFQFGSAGILSTAVLVMAGQVVIANLWLRRFDRGPLEMLWRRLARI